MEMFNIVFIGHPTFSSSQSMPRYVKLLSNWFINKGYKVEVLSPSSYLYEFNFFGGLRKWLGYIDQFIIFQWKLRKKINDSQDTLFVITDHALGPYVPLLLGRPHVVHCHDFLAQQSAMGEIPGIQTRWTGKVYQKWIRKGYSKSRHFISVSKKTRRDLHHMLGYEPGISEVIYNPFNRNFDIVDPPMARNRMSELLKLDLSKGYILHVGGNQWYKNRAGVIQIYDELRAHNDTGVPLLLIGSRPTNQLQMVFDKSPFKNDIHLLTEISDDQLDKLYCGASLLLYPSISEGFGWPIIESMALGLPVITTREDPMLEVGGDAAFYIEKMPEYDLRKSQWAKECAAVVLSVLNLDRAQLETVKNKGFKNVKRFDPLIIMPKVEELYKTLMRL